MHSSPVEGAWVKTEIGDIHLAWTMRTVDAHLLCASVSLSIQVGNCLWTSTKAVMKIKQTSIGGHTPPPKKFVYSLRALLSKYSHGTIALWVEKVILKLALLGNQRIFVLKAGTGYRYPEVCEGERNTEWFSHCSVLQILNKLGRPGLPLSPVAHVSWSISHHTHRGDKAVAYREVSGSYLLHTEMSMTTQGTTQTLCTYSRYHTALCTYSRRAYFNLEEQQANGQT
ncbi:hypothetical protein STEG23_014948, partial [Scotinomys teguina]